MTFDAIAGYNRLIILPCPPEKYTQSTTLSILRKYAQKALCTKTPLTRGVTGKTFTDTEKNTNEKLQKAYTGLPVVRVTQRTAAFQLIFSSGASLRPFEGSPTCRASRGPLAHTFNYFVMSCPILRSFSLLSFRNKFSLKITKHALE